MLAHELIHTIQQRAAKSPSTENLAIGSAEDPHEAEAQHLTKHVLDNGITVPKRTSSVIRLLRACGPNEIGSQTGCIGRGGDITDFGGDSGKIFMFRVNCDEFLPGEKARVQDLASILATDEHLEVDGFASEEGPPQSNEDLSCARAKALASALIVAGVSPSQFDGVYMHGATPGSRAYHRSAVITIRPVSEPATSEDCGALIGNCEFYLCREQRHPCGEKGYYKGYGYKYCERFILLESRLSSPGKDWVRKARRCLQEHIHRNIPIDTPCPKAKQSAFDSHPRCYVLGGVCFSSRMHGGRSGTPLILKITI